MRRTITPLLLVGLIALLGTTALHAHPVDVQSARAACETEADGRGFTVLEAGDPRDHKDGWSIAMRLRAYRGEVSTGSCFADSRTGNVSLYGFGWGDRSPTSANYIFSCASIDGGRHFCSLPLPGQVQVVERYSSAPCEAGRGWVNGCHGRFERMPVGAPLLPSPVPPQRTDAANDSNADSSR